MVAAVAALMATPSLHATLTFVQPMTHSGAGSSNIVGTLGGQLPNSNPTTEAVIAQHLLDMAANRLEANPPVGPAGDYRTTTTEYSGTIGSGIQSAANAYIVSAGWEYALAKYDGPNGGYVLFHLGGQDAILPQFPYDFWTTNHEKYAISHFTVFNPIPVPEPTTLIAGALLLLPFGASALRFVRRNRAGARPCDEELAKTPCPKSE
jgi:hypothetical protein